MYDATEDSVHELVTCGGVQVTLASSLLLIVLSSNRDLFDEASLQQIESYSGALGFTLNVPFEDQGDGTWSMPIAGSADSDFSVRFREPGSGRLITEDPFTMDSYLTGVTATSELTFEQMRRDMSARTTLTYTWEGEGPLAHLLNDGEPIPNPFTMRLSLQDLLALTGGGGFFGSGEPFGGDLGPIDSVLDVEMESSVRFRDQRDDTVIEYDVDVEPGTVRTIAASGSLRFDVHQITASAGPLELRGDATALSFVQRGLLAGPIEYSVSGPDVDLRVTSDFEDGLSYPMTSWSCP